MLMNHKNFHFTQIPDKTNVIFLKSPKTLFLGHFDHFWSFMPDGDFSQKIWLTHITIYGSLTHHHAKFQKKLMSQFWENFRTDRRTDRPYFIGPFQPRPGVQKLNLWLRLWSLMLPYNLDLEPLGSCNSEPLKQPKSSCSQMFKVVLKISQYS